MQEKQTFREITAEYLNPDDFAEFGDVLEASGAPDAIINQGRCGRYHDLARLDFAGGRGGVSVFDAEARQWPIEIDRIERHPLGSQAFAPLDGAPMLVTVAQEGPRGPESLRAFVTRPGQAINLRRGVWHGALTPIERAGLFLVIDRIGEEPNLEERLLAEPCLVSPPA